MKPFQYTSDGAQKLSDFLKKQQENKKNSYNDVGSV